jgi:hypothetical protein
MRGKGPTQSGRSHDHGTYSFYPEVSLWGGFKLGAGWCNAPRPVLRGAGTGWMVEIVWHRRETRRQQRRQTSTCTTRRTRSTHQKLPFPFSIGQSAKRIASSGFKISDCTCLTADRDRGFNKAETRGGVLNYCFLFVCRNTSSDIN